MAFNPEIVKKLQEAVSTGSEVSYKEYSNLVDKRPPAMLRDLLEINTHKSKIDIKKVESQKKILNRFDSAGMSLGALSPKAHDNILDFSEPVNLQ